jgi:DNA-binding transcriptional LysR family regulator
MNLSLRQLRAFAAVAETGSFTLAARNLHLTQAAISVLVRELESELGVRLFDRHTRRVDLSDAGRDFQPYVGRVLRELDDAVHSVGRLRDKKKGLLRIGAPQLMACTLIPPLVAQFSERYPEVEVRLSDMPSDRLLERVLDAEVELAIGPDSPAASNLRQQTLMRDRHLLAAPTGHPLMRKRRVRWVELEGHPFVAPTRDFMQRLAPELSAASVECRLEPVHEVAYMTTALAMVAAGQGITACPSYSAPLIAAWGLATRPLVEPEFFRAVCIYSLPNKSLSPAAEVFVAMLQSSVGGGVSA